MDESDGGVEGDDVFGEFVDDGMGGLRPFAAVARYLQHPLKADIRFCFPTVSYGFTVNATPCGSCWIPIILI